MNIYELMIRLSDGNEFCYTVNFEIDHLNHSMEPPVQHCQERVENSLDDTEEKPV